MSMITETTAVRANMMPPVSEVVERVGNGTIVFDLIAQRGPVWDIQRKSCLIRSLLLGFRTGALLGREEMRGEQKVVSIIEGQQRCRAVYEYLNNQFALDLGDFAITLKIGKDVVELQGKYFKDLPESFQNKIKSSIFFVDYYSQLSDEEANEMFYFSNNGKPIASDQHIWAITKSKKQIEEIAKSSDIFQKIFTEKKLANYEYRTYLIHADSMLNYQKGRGLEKKYLMPVYMEREISSVDVRIMKGICKRLSAIYDLIPEVAKEEKKAVVKMMQSSLGKKTHFSCLFPIMKKSFEDKRSDEDMAKWFCQFFICQRSRTTSSTAYNSASATSTLKPTQVEKRLEELEKDYGKYFK